MLEKQKDCRKKMKLDPSAEYVKYICNLYGNRYNDQDEDSKPLGADWKPGKKAKHLSLEGFRKRLLNSYDIELSTAKIRKVLITGGYWSTERSREVQREYDKLKSIHLVAQKLKLLKLLCLKLNKNLKEMLLEVQK